MPVSGAGTVTGVGTGVGDGDAEGSLLGEAAGLSLGPPDGSPEVPGWDDEDGAATTSIRRRPARASGPSCR